MSSAIEDLRQDCNDAVAAVCARKAIARAAEEAAKNAQATADAAADLERTAREAAKMARGDLKRTERAEAKVSNLLTAAIDRHRRLRARGVAGYTHEPPDPDDSGDTE